MTRIEKCELAVEKGYTYDPLSGNVYGVRGDIIKRTHHSGRIYINLTYNKKLYGLAAHQFAYYMVHGLIIDRVDHIDKDFTNNRINNLRYLTNQQNCFNSSKAKGYYLEKKTGRYKAKIKLNYISIPLGTYDTPEEAHQAYLDAKKIYHII